MSNDSRILIEKFQNNHIYLDQETLLKYEARDQFPFAVIEPESEEQLSELVDECNKIHTRVNVWGNGNHQLLGGPLGPHEVTITTRLFDKIVELEPENLTVTVQSGVQLGQLQAVLAEKGLFFPIGPQFNQSTLGGLAAANVYGDWIEGFGTFRDLVLGGRAVLADGSRIRFGGKTVKNVAGYDMAKLFIGSMGTLGVLTELTLKLSPLPETVLSVSIRIQNKQDIINIQEKINKQALPKLSFKWSNIENNVTLDIYCLESESRFYNDMLKSMFDLPVNITTHDWNSYLATQKDIDLKSEKENFVLKWIVPVSNFTDVIEFVDKELQDLSFHSFGYPGKGIVYTVINSPVQDVYDILVRMRGNAHQLEGKLVCLVSPVKPELEWNVWDVDNNISTWNRKIKQEFDSGYVFTGGRFIDGI